MSRARSAPPDLPGFTLVQTIGGGGFADVFLFTQHRPNRQVAVKVLRPEHLSPERLRQFEVEADLMAEVSTHPFIVTIHASGVAPDGRPFIVMEHYPGPNFGMRARGGTMPVAEVVQVGVQISSAVETAHRSGIVHRDIKPANVLTSSLGWPGLSDFGIAGAQRGGRLDVASGVSVAFAPPEVVRDPDATGSVAGDVYSLAATLYALLAGRSPFWDPGGDNGDDAIRARVLEGRAVPIGRADVPESLALLLANGLAGDPRHRPTSALSLARMLQDVEQERMLPPTRIELPLAGGNAPGPQEPTAPASSAPDTAALAAHAAPLGAPPEVAAPPDGSSPARDVAAPPEPVLQVVDPHTEHRPPPPTADSPSLWDRWRANPVLQWGSIGAVAVVIGVSVLTVALLGREPSTATAPPTTPPPIRSDVTPGPGVPRQVTASLSSDGVLLVTFDTGPGASATTFRVLRTDGDERWPSGERFVDAPGSPVEIRDVPADEQPCVKVQAIAASRISEESREACASATTSTTAVGP